MAFSRLGMRLAFGRGSVPALPLRTRYDRIVPVKKSGIVLCLIALVLPLRAEDPQVTAWRQKAAAGDASAETQLGWAYSDGWGGVTRDYAQAMKWLQKATAQNNADAATQIGWLYEWGHGVRQDPAQAFQWYKKGAESGDAYGELQLGSCYQEGKGVGKDEAQAVAWYTKAARQSEVEAMVRVAFAYQQGKGVPKDLRQAFTYSLFAAYNNSGWAQYNVARCYDMGIFVPKNLTEAYRWTLLAAKQGYNKPGEMQSLYYLSTILTPAQFADAQALVRNWDEERVGDAQPPSAAITFATNRRTTLPLQDAYNELVVTATLNGHPNLKFMVDTGCGPSMVDEKTASAIGLVSGPSIRPLAGFGPNLTLMPEIAQVNLELPGVKLSGINLGTVSLSDWDVHFGMHIDGILGEDLLKRLVMRIDYIHHTLELIDGAAFKPAEATGTAIPLTFCGISPYITCVVGDKGAFCDPTRFMLDTGNAGTLVLSRNFCEANPSLDLKGGAADPAGVIGGILEASTLKVSQLKLGDVVVENPAVDIAADQGVLSAVVGCIGNEVLRRFDVTIDYPESKLFLKPDSRFNDPFFYANNGLDVWATGADFRIYVVHDITPDTSGAREGFKVGDILTQFDSVAMPTQSMSQARLLFRLPGKHRVIVMRDGKPVTLEHSREDLASSKTGT